jgi:hypothetical protein
MLIEVIEVIANAQIRIDCMLLGRVIDVIKVPANAKAPILVTVFGIVTVFKDEH